MKANYLKIVFWYFFKRGKFKLFWCYSKTFSNDFAYYRVDGKKSKYCNLVYKAIKRKRLKQVKHLNSNIKKSNKLCLY